MRPTHVTAFFNLFKGLSYSPNSTLINNKVKHVRLRLCSVVESESKCIQDRFKNNLK